MIHTPSNILGTQASISITHHKTDTFTTEDRN